MVGGATCVVGVLPEDHDLLRALPSLGHPVLRVASPAGAREAARSAGGAVVLLDERLAAERTPTGTAWAPPALVELLRDRTRVRLLVLCRSRATALTWLEAGADDATTTAAGPREVAARVAALARRPFRLVPLPRQEPVVAGELVVDAAARSVRVGGDPRALPAAQFRLLLALARRHPEVVSLEALERELWGGVGVRRSNALRVHVRRLRRAIEEDAARPRRLVTVPGQGYRLLP